MNAKPLLSRLATLCAMLVSATALAGPPWSYQFLGPNPPGAPQTFVAPSTGIPSGQTGWDLLIDSAIIREPVYPDTDAQHNSVCFNQDPPPPPFRVINTFPETIFICANHLMTSVNDPDYGEAVLTPDHQVDISGTTTAIINWSVSSYRDSGRDWWDVQLTPMANNQVSFSTIQLTATDPYGCPTDSVGLFGKPPGSLSVDANVLMAFASPGMGLCSQGTCGAYCLTAFQSGPPATGIVGHVSAVVRDKYELALSHAHVRFSLYYQSATPLPPPPGYPISVCPETSDGSGDHCRADWFDQDINPPLPWDTAILQLSHHSYNPRKDCTCFENTWHWSDIYISSSAAFTITQSDTRVVKDGVPATVNFARPAPLNSMLRFEGLSGSQIQYSTNGGSTWQTAAWQPIPSTWGPLASTCRARSYWQSVPTGTTSVQFRGDSYCLTAGHWAVRDITLWSPSP